MKKDGSLTISGLTTAIPTGTAAVDISSLNGTFDITNAFKAGTGYIVELDGTAGGNTNLGVATTWTNDSTTLQTTYVEGATISANST